MKQNIQQIKPQQPIMCNFENHSYPKQVIDKCIYKSWFVAGMRSLVDKAKAVGRKGILLGILLASALPAYGQNIGLKPVYLGRTPGYTAAIANGDFNNDGRIDKAELNTNGYVHRYFHNGSSYDNGKIIARTIGTGSDIISGDFDLDGDIDLLASDLEGQAFFLENLGNGDFAEERGLFDREDRPGRITGISAYEEKNSKGKDSIVLWMVTPSSRYGIRIYPENL